MNNGYNILLKLAQQQQNPHQLTIPGIKPQYQPLPHQQEFLERLIANRGVIVAAHKVGTGKTFSSIAAEMLMEAMGKSNGALVIVPAALRKNYADAIKQFTDGASVQVVGPKNEKESVYVTDVKPGHNFTIVSYELFREHPEVALASGANTLILDEFHRVRNPEGDTFDSIMSVRPAFKNFIGLTGSIVNNDPSDIAPLVSLAMGARFMTRAQFKNRFERRAAREKGFFGGSQYLHEMQDLPTLQRTVGPLVDYVSGDLVESKMPRRDVRVVPVEMSPEQEDYYNYVLNRVGPLTAWKIRNNVSVSEDELRTVFQSLIHARRASNSIASVRKDITLEQSAMMTPKVKKLLDDTEMELRNVPDAQIVIYSNLIQGGLDVVAAGLRARGIPFGVFIGKGRQLDETKSTEQTRNKAVEDFQQGKLKVLLISGAGAEGLDLKNATMFQALDGHFNPERVLQAEARARRIGGLAQRPPEQRVVKIRRYVSSLEQGLVDKLLGRRTTSVDEWIYNVASRKMELNRQLQQALATAPKPPGPKLEEVISNLRTTQQEAATTASPRRRAPTGIELPKTPGAKYERRFRMPDGSIQYQYTRDNVG